METTKVSDPAVPTYKLSNCCAFTSEHTPDINFYTVYPVITMSNTLLYLLLCV
ncbi:hypothetical protein K440DRAFT_612158 [Wilcoxina mikolae CBS 423.85]|nr:hypothetical protein K440DRAFT_612158 [Wilcoxina mikolae CBS 423.85]